MDKELIETNINHMLENKRAKLYGTGLPEKRALYVQKFLVANASLKDKKMLAFFKNEAKTRGMKPNELRDLIIEKASYLMGKEDELEKLSYETKLKLAKINDINKLEKIQQEFEEKLEKI